MKHKISGYKLQRNACARKALLRGLVTSVIVEERFTATVTKAKAAAPTAFLHFSILAFLVPSSPAQALSSASKSTASIQGACSRSQWQDCAWRFGQRSPLDSNPHDKYARKDCALVSTISNLLLALSLLC